MKKLESLSKKIEDIEKNQMEIFKWKNIITEFFNSMDGLNSRMERTENQ